VVEPAEELMTAAPNMSAAPNQLDHIDSELETLLTSFSSNYVWEYGNVKDGLREPYEKAKRDQWNPTTQLAWDTDVDPESEIMPSAINPMNDYKPFQKLDEKERRRFQHAQISLQLSQFLHGEQGALIVASQLRRVGLRPSSGCRRRTWRPSTARRRRVPALHPYRVGLPFEMSHDRVHHAVWFFLDQPVTGR
jgi:hypothetical protein